MTLESISHVCMLVWLVGLMLSMGLSVSAREIFSSIANTSMLVRAFAVNFLLVPFIGFGLLVLLRAHPMVSAGFLAGFCFSGAPLGPPTAKIAKGDAPLAVGIMVALALATPFLSPALLSFYLARISENHPLVVDYFAIFKIILMGQLIPLGLGLAAKHFFPSVTDRALRFLKIFNNVLFLLVIVLVCATQYSSLGDFGSKAFWGMAILFCASVVAAWFFGGSVLEERKSLVFNTTVRSGATAMVIVSASFPPGPALSATLAYTLFSQAGTFILAFAASRYTARGV